MIRREDYRGPLTKSAQAMFCRLERNTGARAVKSQPPSPVRRLMNNLGLSMAVLRHWEDVGVIALGRRDGKRVIGLDHLECILLVRQLRRAGFSLRQIAWLCPEGPPSGPVMREALAARSDGERLLMDLDFRWRLAAKACIDA
jgi:DNA-binding transcriptional MerR regulator